MKDNLNLNLRKLDNHHSWSWITRHIKITWSGKSNIYSRCKLTFKLFTVQYIFNWHPITLHMNNLFIIIEITAIITKNLLNLVKKESNTCFNSISVSIPYWNYALVSKEMCTLSDNNFNFAFNIWGRFTVDLLIQSKLLMIWSSWKDFKGNHCELNWKKFCVYTLTVCSKILE